MKLGANILDRDVGHDRILDTQAGISMHTLDIGIAQQRDGDGVEFPMVWRCLNKVWL